MRGAEIDPMSEKVLPEYRVPESHRASALAWVRRSLLALLLSAAAVLAVLVAAHREFQVDEVEHIHTSYNLRDGRMIYRDFVQVHPPLLYFVLYPFIHPDDPVGSFRRARGVSTAILFCTILLTARCAWRLEGKAGAALAGGLGLLETTLIERGMEVRADGLLALLVMAALVVEFGRENRGTATRFAFEALLLGSGLMVTLKAIFPIALFGILWVATAIRRRRVALLLGPLLAGLLPFLVTFCILWLFGAGPEFVRQSILDAGTSTVAPEARVTFGPTGFVLSEGSRNLVFFLICLVAAGSELRLASTSADFDRRRRFVLWLALGMFASLWANPFPWPYVQVAVLPPLVVLGACGVLALLRRARASAGPGSIPLFDWAPVLLLIFAASTAAPRLVSKSVTATARQFETLLEVQRVSAPDDRFFDLAGLYFRPDAYPVFAMSGGMFHWYTLGKYPPITPALRENEAVGIIMNYRLAWLRPDEREFVKERFVHHTGNLFLLGRDLTGIPPGSETVFEVLKTKPFRIDGTARLRIDGREFRGGILARGVHAILLENREGPARLILDTPPPIPAATSPTDLFAQYD
jgi:hypothetical protein